MRLLFVKHSLNWPRNRGHDVHGYFLMRALASMGHEINLFVVERPTPEALAGLPHVLTLASEVEIDASAGHVPAGWARRRFCSYWGIEARDLGAAAATAERWKPDAVVAIGPEVLPFLAVTTSVPRIWYAADDLCWQHFTQVRGWNLESWRNLRNALVYAAYERAFASAVSRAWAVSSLDARALAWIGGLAQVDIVPNGVDTEFFTPVDEQEQPESAIFWGNLNFRPNVEAVEWFCEKVWPLVRAAHPSATLTLAGYSPSPEILSRSGVDGVTVVAALPDLRRAIARHQVAVMPFRSGGGLKNKMLEAAAMGRSTVCSALALNGLNGAAAEAFLLAKEPDEWVSRMAGLWRDAQARRVLGCRARRWVEANHTWEQSAYAALASLS